MQAPAANPVVGRQSETAALAEAVEALKAGRGSVVLIAGEPGIGKTTMARHAGELAREAGIETAWGFAWEAGGAPAFWPWTQLLRSVLALRTSVSTDGLAQLLPETAGTTAGNDLQPDHAKFALLESVRRFLQEAAAEGPLLVVLEDLHAADVDSLILLQHVARHSETMPIMFVGTYRELEARMRDSMEPLWLTARNARVLQPQRLDEERIAEFLQAQAGEAATDDKVSALFEATSGNPLFLTELVGLMGRTSDVTLPQTVQQVIEQQLELLPQATVQLMTKAAVLGRGCRVATLASLTGVSVQDAEATLEPGVTAGTMYASQPGWFRFSHALHREVLYNSLPQTERQDLHVAAAAVVRRAIDDGDEDCWTAYANHLDRSGPDNRPQAVAAWRNASRRAKARLAFDDAAESLKSALRTFGDGPRFDPAERCALLSEVAEAMYLAGDVAGGRERCREAFAIAQTLEDPGLMAVTAIAWGNAFVVASVDADMIAALRACLEVLDEDDVRNRSKIQARLAAALQPAENPDEPMQMAREALALARTVDDPQNLYVVLKSAIGALMDFAPPDERLALNREFESLAREFDFISGQFRSHLRMTIDAAELGDRSLVIKSIDSCQQIADRIGLPHYLWRAAAARAMQAIIEGRFATAATLIDEAQAHADLCGDLEARVTLPLQRFMLLVEWDSPETTPLADIRTQLEDAYQGGMAGTRFFVEPFVAAFTEDASGSGAAALVSNEMIVERTFTGGDRFSLANLGELAAAAGRMDLALRAYERILPSADTCLTTGLMGSCWCGPVALSMGVIAIADQRPDDARKHLEQALIVAEGMNARPFIARIWRLLGELIGSDAYRERADKMFRELGLRANRRAPVSNEPVARSSDFELRRDGEVWQVSYAGQQATMKNSKGLEMLARLVAAPDTELHVLDLSGAIPEVATGDAGPELDDQARAAYQTRLADLAEELEEAQSLGDIGRADELRGELEFLQQELSRAFGLGGRQRRAGSAAERARVNVRRRIKDAIQRISDSHPDAGRYLDNSIKTGTYCRYSPT